MNISLPKKNNQRLIYADLTYEIRKAVFNVYNLLGFGHKENVYQKALEKELKELNVPFVREQSLSVSYKDEIVGIYRPDFVVDQKVIVELKSLSSLPESLDSQLLHYLKTTGFRLGLLINFGTPKLFIKRLIWTENQKSASISNEISGNQ